MDKPRLPLLLAVVAVLAVLRFGIVPWAEAQNATRDELEVLTRRLDRSEGVVQNRDAILAARKLLRSNAEKLHARFPQPGTADEFRLGTQQRIGQVAQSAGVQMTVFDWVLEGRIDGTDLAYGRARLNFEGPLRDLVRAHGELEGALPNAAIRELNVLGVVPAGEAGDVRATATFLIDVLYRRKEAK